MSPRASWWIAALGAAFLGYFGLLVYCEALRSRPIGFLVQFDATGMVVEAIVPGSAASNAGLVPGDRIVTANGRSIYVRGDWTVVDANLSAGRELRLVVERDGNRSTLTARLQRESLDFWKSGAGIVLAVARLTQLATLLIAMLVAIKRPGDPLARLGAWLLASGGVFSIVLPPGIAGVWSSLPTAIGALLWIPFASSLAVGAILFTFFAAFPRPLFTSRLIWVAAWTPMLVGEAQFLLSFVQVVYTPVVVGNPADPRLVMLLSAMYSGAGLVALALNYSRLHDVNDRRRVRSIVPGSIIALVSGMAMAMFYLRRSPVDMTTPLFGSPVMAITTLMLLALPFSFAYAILRRRMFDLTTLLRQGVRYALARRVVLSAPVILAAALIADVAAQHDRRVDEVLAGRLTVYLLFLGVAAYIALRREHWLAALDRRFFRERYSAQRIVHNVASQLRASGTVESVAPFMVAQIEEALHPRFAALLVRAEGSDVFAAVASAPLGAAPPPVPARWKVVALTRLLTGPLVLPPDAKGHLSHQLPPVEHAFIRDAGVEVMVGVPCQENATRDLLLVLGAKRSEEPYSTEDLDLLGAVGDALALVVQRRDDGAPLAVTLDECPDCGRCYDSGTARCTADQRELVPAQLGRVVASRYRLDCRFAEGGMSKLYRATDLALKRDVAVKVLREEWMAQRDGPERFRREAQIAAGFSHPNVVTIFDFGLSGDVAFLVMELLPGRTLRAEMEGCSRLPVPRAVDVMRQVGSAVEAAHARGLIHRDLKPENIFLCRTDAHDVVKVLDFGLAKFTGAAQKELASGLLIGTPAYMAPEQLRGEEASPAWDLWALSALAFEMITGVLPFAAASAAWPTGGASTPTGRWPDGLGGLSGELLVFEPFFAAALSIDPAGRPPSVQQLIAGLESAAALLPVA
jgi:tRNA A-37 threonylcarbamoyl transferase component Bud32